MSKKPKTKLINEKAFNEAMQSIANSIKETNRNCSKVTVTAIPLDSDDILDAETKAVLETSLNKALKKIKQAVETAESDASEETCCSEGCDCSCDREAMIDSFSRNVNKIKVDFNDEEDDGEDLLEEICDNTKMELPISVMLDVSLVRRLIKAVSKECEYLDPDELFSSECKLEVCMATEHLLLPLIG